MRSRSRTAPWLTTWAGRAVVAQRLDRVRFLQHYQMSGIARRQGEVRDIHGASGIHRHQVIEPVDLLACGHPEQVGGEEGDFQHVVTAERVIGVRDVVLSKTDQDAVFEKFTDARVQRAGMRIAHHPGRRRV